MSERDLVIVNDEAWTREEWERQEKLRAKWRAYNERNRAKRRAYYNKWREANREHRREYMRTYVRKDRRRLVGSLHDGGCTGPTKATGCRCSKIKCYDKP